MTIKTKSPKETQKIAKNLAAKILKSKPGRRDGGTVVIALEGELGAGKTVFVKGFAKALGIKSHITSPTFVILKRYKLSAISHKLMFHIDAYRIKDHHDLISLGIREILSNPQNIVLIEWSERVRQILPNKHIKIHIDHIDSSKRKIIVSGI